MIKLKEILNESSEGEATYKELMKVEKVINNLERAFKREQRDMAQPRAQNIKVNLVQLKRAWTAIWADFQGK
jgi:uncharacterized membrane protein